MSRSYLLDEVEDEQGEEARAVAEEWIRELVVLSFRENRRGGDPIAHAADGRAVFPDKFQGGDDIQSGEHWICSVSQKGESTFFAAPLARLDERFFADLSPQERSRLARVVVDEYQDELNDDLQAVLQEARGRDEEFSRLEAERNELRERLGELNEQYDETVARLQQMESSMAVTKPEQSNGQGATQPRNGSGKQTAVVGRESRVERFTVKRIESDVLYCEGFVDSNYHGHVSPNQRTLFFKSYGRGTLACREGRLEIPGLESILPGDVEELEARYDPRHGGFFLKLQ